MAPGDPGKTTSDAGMLRNKIEGLDRATKDELLIQAAYSDEVIAEGIMETALSYLPEPLETLPDDVRGKHLVLWMIRRTIGYLPDVVRDELLCFAGLSSEATATEIMDAPRVNGNEINKEGNEGANEE